MINSSKKIIGDVYINFMYNNFYNLVKLNHQDNKNFKNGGAILINMSDKRVKSGEIVVNFMPLELFPENIVKQFTYNPNDKTAKYLIINCPPIDHIIEESNDYLYIVLQTGKDGKKEYVFCCSCEKLSKNKYSYVFRYKIENEKNLKNENENKNLKTNKKILDTENKIKNKKIKKSDEEILNEMKNNMAWTLDGTERASDYINFCKKCIGGDGHVEYNNFRNNSKFTNVIISGYEWQGVEYEKRILTENKNVLKKIEELRKNDTIGKPVVYNFSSMGPFSVLTLRHINSYYEIQKEFGGLEDKNIIEIGSSYGGLCYVASVLCNQEWKSYTLVDIPEVLELSRKVLKDLGVDMTKLKFMTMVDLENKKELSKNNFGWDLMISEMTISEMNGDMVSFYFNNVANYSKNAYLAMNIWDSVNKKVFKKGLKKIYQAVYEKKEYARGEWPNYLLFCHK